LRSVLCKEVGQARPKFIPLTTQLRNLTLKARNALLQLDAIILLGCVDAVLLALGSLDLGDDGFLHDLSCWSVEYFVDINFFGLTNRERDDLCE